MNATFSRPQGPSHAMLHGVHPCTCGPPSTWGSKAAPNFAKSNAARSQGRRGIPRCAPGDSKAPQSHRGYHRERPSGSRGRLLPPRTLPGHLPSSAAWAPRVHPPPGAAGLGDGAQRKMPAGPGGKACPGLHLWPVPVAMNPPIAEDPSAPAQLDSEPSAQSLCQAGLDARTCPRPSPRSHHGKGPLQTD